MYNKASNILTFLTSLLWQADACCCGLSACIQPGSANNTVIYSIHNIQSEIASVKNSAPFDMDKNHAKGIFFAMNPFTSIFNLIELK